ncbi:MAG TPA: M56 family metallopeptidase, partial [Gelidibacter sp.]|uniref:M56 family metallopeptidase n=1 Tax=Gelidibacter sp. TaxID=2018083 RepID=UPI002B9EFAFF
MHQLKRYYLLAAILIALTIPLITFTTYIEPVVSNFTEIKTYLVVDIEQEITKKPFNYLPIILLSIYGIGVILFGIKFILNLSKILFRIKQNPKRKTHDFTFVLLSDLIVPHTFFRYIFLNQQKFETQQIPKEVFIHEKAHAKQKHSIDILLIELLHILFWFNPLIYFMKQFIKMNHEFLADEAVLKQGIEPSIYQQLLLTFSSNVTEPKL